MIWFKGSLPTKRCHVSDVKQVLPSDWQELQVSTIRTLARWGSQGGVEGFWLQRIERSIGAFVSVELFVGCFYGPKWSEGCFKKRSLRCSMVSSRGPCLEPPKFSSANCFDPVLSSIF